MRLPALFLLVLLTLPMGEGVREALTEITGYKIVSGQMIFLNKTMDVALKAKGKDPFGYVYIIRVRWYGGYPVKISVSDALEEL